MSLIPILKQMSTLTLLMLGGYFANRFGIMGADAQKWLSKLLVNITCPALILSSVTTGQRLESNGMLLMVFGVAAAYYLILPVVAKVLALTGPAQHRSEFESMLVYSNLGFMGIPVANAVLGKEAILYVSILMAVFNISLFSYGTILLGNKSGSTEKLRLKRMINPGTVSAVAAVLLYLWNISIPSLLLEPIASVGSTTTPLAMMVVGASLANSRIRDLFNERSMIPLTVLRLLVLPLLVWGCCRLFVRDGLLAGVLILSTGMPVGSSIAMLCNELNRDGTYIAKGLVFTTLFSVVTIPLLALIL